MRVNTSDSAIPIASRRFDLAGLVVAAIITLAISLQPFMLLRPNRIAASMPVSLLDALPVAWSSLLIALIMMVALILALRSNAWLRLIASFSLLIGVAIAAGWSATFLMPPGNTYARVSPGGCVWLIVFALCLATGDALVRLRLTPPPRVAALALFIAVAALLLASGIWDDLSIMKEYATRKGAFINALAMHAALASGSLVTSFFIAIPAGIFIYRRKRIRDIVISALNVIQTIPSMALFGLLIAPLAWVGANLPGASALGIAGIGPAPAFIALVFYSLLPLVSATLDGLDAVPPAIRDAADGMGMTEKQRLVSIELPLALPFILSGVRFVLVQNIGLTVIAGLVGGGGLGIFVFQGISQTATDLVLLGAFPVVVMAFVAAILLDAAIEMSRMNNDEEPAR